jgi:osmotically-inducible protein OsmY
MTPDQKLQKLVLEALDFNPDVDCSHIGVAARDGIVTLSGHVRSNAEKRAAELAAGGTAGVRAVIDDLFVELPGRVQSADEAIAERCVAHLAADRATELDRVHLVVADGVVRLHGEVDREGERERIESRLRELDFLSGLVNELVVRPPVRAEFVRQKVRDALRPISAINAESIVVKTAGSRVTLTGAVNSWHERGVAESAAWSVPGVSCVEDLIEVQQ